MDPLVRGALAAQHAGQKSLGTAVSLLFSGYLVAWSAQATAHWFDLCMAGLLAVVLTKRAVRRLRRLSPIDVARQDLELFSALSVAIYAVILVVDGSRGGPLYSLVYAAVMVTAAFARPLATLGSVAFYFGIEVALSWTKTKQLDGGLAVRLALISLFAILNLTIFQAELARMRRLSRERIQREIERVKDAARSYRLVGAASSVEPASSHGHEVPKGSNARRDDERVVRSSVDEIHLALVFTLGLLRQLLNLKSAVVLWLSPDGKKLTVHELMSDEESIASGPFSVKEGLFAAALSSLESVSIVGAKAAQHAPYYQEARPVGMVCAIPVLEQRSARGLLVVDRENAEPLSREQEMLLWQTTAFILRAVENERSFVQLERAKVEQGKLYRSVQLLNEARSEVQVIQAGVRSARDMTAFDFAAVTLFQRTTREHEICAVSGEGADDLVGRSFKHNSGLVSMVVANRHPLPYRGHYDSERHVVFSRNLPIPSMPSLLVLPLLVHDTVLGTLILGSQERGALGDSVRPMLEVLAQHVAVSLSNARMLKRLEDLATTDGLTGLLNKRALTDVARHKLKSAERFKKPLSLLVCDIDHFKKVNDNYGHDVGDVVIKGFSDVLKRVKRDTDSVGRFGGEEFVLVCEQTDAHGAELLAERIRAELASVVFHTPQGQLSVTCSVGVSTFPSAGQDWEQLFKATDEALYVSKRGGRNRVTLWTPSLRGVAA